MLISLSIIDALEPAASIYLPSTFTKNEAMMRPVSAGLYPLPGKLLDEVTQSHNVTMEDAHAVICNYIQAVFLRPEP